MMPNQPAEIIPSNQIISLLAPGEGFANDRPKGKFISPRLVRDEFGVPMQLKTPSLAQLKGLSPGQLSLVAQRYGLEKPWSAMVADGTQRMSGLASLPPGTAQFGDIIDRAVKPMANAQLGRARDSMRRYQQIAALDGDINTNLVRVDEGDDDVCESCDSLSGMEGTIADFQGEMPGGQT